MGLSLIEALTNACKNLGAKLLQKSEMRKDIVIEFELQGFWLKWR